MLFISLADERRRFPYPLIYLRRRVDLGGLPCRHEPLPCPGRQACTVRYRPDASSHRSPPHLNGLRRDAVAIAMAGPTHLAVRARRDGSPGPVDLTWGPGGAGVGGRVDLALVHHRHKPLPYPSPQACTAQISTRRILALQPSVSGLRAERRGGRRYDRPNSPGRPHST
jgi:hypothetical protein